MRAQGRLPSMVAALHAIAMLSCEGKPAILDVREVAAATGVASAARAGPPPTPAVAAKKSAPKAHCKHAPVEPSCRNGFCLVPSGCFTLGSPRTEPFVAARDDKEVEVRLTRSFFIGQTEVTRKEWLGSGLGDPAIDWTFAGSPERARPPQGYSLCKELKCPVVWVSFEDAAAYANLRSKKERLRPCYLLSDCKGSPGSHMRCRSVRVDAKSPYECEGYRLPTEAEWEYAARAGTRSAYFSGDMHPDREAAEQCRVDKNLDVIGWYCGNSSSKPGEGRGRPHPVARKAANPWGLYDVSGNAYEWTNDLYDPRGYGDGPLQNPVFGVVDPSDLTPREHPVYGTRYLDADGFAGYRVSRGGAFDLWSFLAKSGRRSPAAGAGGQHHGFRLARTAPGPAPESGHTL